MKDIPNYEGLYQVDKQGNVLSLKTKKLLKPFLSYSKSSGLKYLDVALSKNGSLKKYRVHRLVAMTYIPNPDNKFCVDHINRVQDDNRVENLRWASRGENQQNKGKGDKTYSSKYKGVCWDGANNKWIVFVTPPCGRQRNYGRYETEVEAAKAYNEFAIKNYGEFAYLNEV